MQHVKAASVLLIPIWLAACVTVNVYFPAAAAERAADRFIQDVYGQQGKQPEEAPQQSEPEPGPQSQRLRAGPLVAMVLEAIIPEARAQANIDISTPAIQAIKQSMKQRQAKLAPYYQSGAVGMTSDGLITIRDLGAVPLRERNTVRKLVADENRDRDTLYREIARANGHPEWESEIRQTFARRWIANAPGGWWYQDSGGNWKRK